MDNKKPAGKKAPSKKPGTKKAASKKWSKTATEHSDAMDLEQDIFKSKDAVKIAASVKKV